MLKKVITANKVYLKPKAYEDLENIYNYSTLNFGETKAINYINDIDQVFRKLSKGDIRGKTCDYIKVNLRKLNVNSHVIFYKHNKNLIEIIRILHQQQDFPRHL